MFGRVRTKDDTHWSSSVQRRDRPYTPCINGLSEPGIRHKCGDCEEVFMCRLCVFVRYKNNWYSDLMIQYHASHAEALPTYCTKCTKKREQEQK